MEYSKLRGYNISRLTLRTVALGMNYGISNKEGKPDKTQSSGIISSAAGLSYEIKKIIKSRFEDVPEHIITPGQWSLT